MAGMLSIIFALLAFLCLLAAGRALFRHGSGTAEERMGHAWIVALCLFGFGASLFAAIILAAIGGIS